MFNFVKSRSFKKYLFSSNWMFAEKAVQISSSLIIGIYVARYLGPERLGLLSYAIVMVGLIRPFWMLGLSPIANKKFIEKSDCEGLIFGTSLVAQVVAFFVIGILAAVYLIYSEDFSKNEKIILSILFIGQIFILSQIFEQYFNARIKSKYISISGVVANILTGAARLGMVLLELDLVYFALAVVIEIFVKFILLTYFFLKQTTSQKTWLFDYAFLKSMLDSSWPFIITGAMTGMYMKIDQVMVKHLLGNESAGVYAIAVKLSEIWFVIPLVLTRVLFPALVEAYKTSNVLFNDRMRKFYVYITLFALAITLTMTLISGPLINTLFGIEFLESGEVFDWYIWTIIFVYVGLVSEKWMFIHGLQKISLYNKIAAALVNIILDYYLIIIVGIEGAAISSIVAYAVSVFIGPMLWKESRVNIFLYFSSFKLALGCKK